MNKKKTSGEKENKVIDNPVLENLRKERIRQGITYENCRWGKLYCIIMIDSDEGDESHCPLCGCWFPKKGKVVVEHSVVNMNCVDE